MPTSSSACTAQAVDSLAALEALQADWWDLWRRARASPFQSPAWLLPWWRHVGRGTLATVAVRSVASGVLVGLAPLYVQRDAAGGRRHLFPIGIATTDRLDLLVQPGWETPVAQALVGHVAARAEHWDVLEVPQLPPDSPLAALPWPAGWTARLAQDEPHPVLALGGGLPVAMARRLATAQRRAARAGTLAWEEARADTLAALLDLLVHLHTARWARRELPGVLADADVLAAHRESAPLLLAEGLLRLLALRLDGRAIGVLYALADAAGLPRRRWCYYIAGFDPAVASLSPGTLLVGEAIERARAEGAAAFDFLRGAEPYKYGWGAVDEPMATLRVVRG